MAVTVPTALDAVHIYAPCSAPDTVLNLITPFSSMISVFCVISALFALQLQLYK